ncbi:DUF6074 family protein [Mesorhizobium sp. f-mel]
MRRDQWLYAAPSTEPGRCQKALLTKFSNPPMLIRETEGVRCLMCDSNISAFPLHRRRKLVEGIARVLESKHGEDANAFWRSTAKAILVQLSESGIAPGLAEQEVGTLLHAVLGDLATRSAAKLSR